MFFSKAFCFALNYIVYMSQHSVNTQPGIDVTPLLTKSLLNLYQIIPHIEKAPTGLIVKVTQDM